MLKIVWPIIHAFVLVSKLALAKQGKPPIPMLPMTCATNWTWW